MHAQDLVINKRSNRHTVKNILKFLPQTDRIPVLALIIEAIDSINLPALVVSSQQEEVLLKLDFIRE